MDTYTPTLMLTLGFALSFALVTLMWPSNRKEEKKIKKKSKEKEGGLTINLVRTIDVEVIARPPDMSLMHISRLLRA